MMQSTDFRNGDDLSGIWVTESAVAQAYLSLSSSAYGSDDNSPKTIENGGEGYFH